MFSENRQPTVAQCLVHFLDSCSNLAFWCLQDRQKCLVRISEVTRNVPEAVSSFVNLVIENGYCSAAAGRPPNAGASDANAEQVKTGGSSSAVHRADRPRKLYTGTWISGMEEPTALHQQEAKRSGLDCVSDAWRARRQQHCMSCREEPPGESSRRFARRRRVCLKVS